MKCAKFLSLLCLLAFSGHVFSKTACFVVVGKLQCRSETEKHVDVELHLMDDDGPLNPDDTMGWTTTSDDGRFKVEGCGYDFLSKPDPYLRIWHHCRSKQGITKKYRLYSVKYAPEAIDAGLIRLD